MERIRAASGVEEGVRCRPAEARGGEERCCTAVDGADPGHRIHESRRLGPTRIRPWEEAMRLDSPGTEVARRRGTVFAGGSGEASGAWRRRRRLVAGGWRPASGIAARRAGAAVRLSPCGTATAGMRLRACGTEVVSVESVGFYWAGPYRDARYVSSGVSDFNENNTKSDTRRIRILGVSDTYPYPIRIGYAASVKYPCNIDEKR